MLGEFYLDCFFFSLYVQNCRDNTAGERCEYCADGFNGDATRGTPYDCSGGDSQGEIATCQVNECEFIEFSHNC